MGCHSDAGGLAGVRDARDVVVRAHSKILEMNKLAAPPGVLEVVDLTSLRERQRQRAAEASLTVLLKVSLFCVSCGDPAFGIAVFLLKVSALFFLLFCTFDF